MQRLTAVQSGDPGALADVYGTHGEAVYRLAFRLTESAADAKDVMQDVFLALPEALRTYDGSKSFDRWLMTVASRTALLKMRVRRRRREVGLGVIGGLVQSRREMPIVDRLELERAIGRLPESLRTVFVLKEIQGFSHEEIAELLGIRRGASEVRFFRARLLLQRWLRHVR